jgi:hypothetical protein
MRRRTPLALGCWINFKMVSPCRRPPLLLNRRISARPEQLVVEDYIDRSQSTRNCRTKWLLLAQSVDSLPRSKLRRSWGYCSISQAGQIARLAAHDPNRPARIAVTQPVIQQPRFRRAHPAAAFPALPFSVRRSPGPSKTRLLEPLGLSN